MALGKGGWCMALNGVAGARRAPWVCTLVFAAWGTGCSLVIDVEPDCSEVSSCGGYRCNTENTACLDTCRTDDDCVVGFGCDVQSSACVASGCFPQNRVFENGELQQSWSGFASGYAGNLYLTGVTQANEPAQALFYQLDGQGVLRLGGGGPQFFRLSPDNVRGQNDIAMAFGTAGQVGANADSALALWVEEATDNPRFRVRANSFPEGGFTASARRSLASRGARPVGLRARAQRDGFIATWLDQDALTSATVSGRLNLALIGLDGNVREDTTVGTFPPEGSPRRVRTWPALSRTNAGALYAVAVQGGAGQQFSVLGGAVSDALPERLPEDAWHTSGFEVTDVVLGSSGPQAAVVWRQARSGGGFELLARRLTLAGVLLDATEQPIRIDPLFSHATSSRPTMVAADGNGGFAVAFTGARGARSGLWVAHFGADARPIGLPFLVSDTNIPLERLERFDIVATDAGYVVQWLLQNESDSSRRTLFYRSFRCEP